MADLLAPAPLRSVRCLVATSRLIVAWSKRRSLAPLVRSRLAKGLRVDWPGLRLALILLVARGQRNPPGPPTCLDENLGVRPAWGTRWRKRRERAPLGRLSREAPNWSVFQRAPMPTDRWSPLRSTAERRESPGPSKLAQRRGCCIATTHEPAGCSYLAWRQPMATLVGCRRAACRADWRSPM